MSHNIDDLLEEIEILKGYKHMHQKLNEQNKRYREAIEKAIEMISESTGTITTPKEMSLYDAWILKSMLRETILEGEE